MHQNARSKTAWSVLLFSLALVSIDFFLGPEYQVALLFTLPVAWAAWRLGFPFSAALAVMFCVMRFLCHWAWGFPMMLNPATVNTLIRSVTLIAIAMGTAQIAWKVQKLKRRIQQLEGHFPVCSACSQVQKPDGDWVPIDVPIPTDERQTILCPHCQHKSH